VRRPTASGEELRIGRPGRCAGDRFALPKGSYPFGAARDHEIEVSQVDFPEESMLTAPELAIALLA